MDTSQNPGTAPPVFIISGGAGALGKHLARVVLAQFPDIDSEIIIIPQVRTTTQLAEAVAQAAARRGVVIHTMVDRRLHDTLVQLTATHGIPTIDTIGDALDRLGQVFDAAPLRLPGLYQGDEEAYVERIRAIEYTVDHDDGRNPNELYQADVVLTGVSRVGKTPLSIYLSVLGWRVANVPLVKDIPPPRQLFEIDRRRVVGLMIDVDSLASHRSWRQQSLRGMAGSNYTDPTALYDELDYARHIFRKGGFGVVDVTNKPIEETADQVIGLISRWFEHRIKPPRLR